MVFNMSEIVDVDRSTSTRQIIAGTCRAYADSAGEYAAATRDYDAYPGLRNQLVGFEKKLPADLPVLDLGCGGGRDSRLLADLGRKVIAADICLPMLTRARELSGQHGTSEYLRLDMLTLPFADRSLGGIWASGSMLHLPSAEIPHALSEVARTLVTGGVVAISMKAGEREGWRQDGTLRGRRWFTYVRPDRFAATMGAAGFDEVRTESSGRPGWFVARGHKKSAA
jgi:SAM-dependent methyltransferase